MPWGAAVGAIGGALINNMGKDKNGGAGTSTATKEPWAVAAPWLTDQIGIGQDLQNQYRANPFSEQQEQAYANQYAQSDYMRELIPSLLTQMQKQPGGFDRNNPTAKPTSAWDWGVTGGGTGAGLGGGGGSMSAAAQRQADADAAAAAARAAAMAKSWNWDGQFHNQGDVLTGLNFKDHSAGQQLQGEGGFGAFRYGQEAPQAGTNAYRDMSEYFLRGGQDPNNLYGRGVDPRTLEYFPAGGA